jgi:predicted amidohydrolase
MKITLIQDVIAWSDKQANFNRINKQLEALQGKTDLVVLPEMFSTGFCTDRLDLAEEGNGETLQALSSWSKKFGFSLTGSFIARENDFYYNRSFFVFPDGKIQTADKRHLFRHGGEHQYFSAGKRHLLVNYQDWKICVLVCYDVRFPVWSRNVDNRYDLLIYPANFPSKRIRDWDILLQARAIENQAYVCGLNRIGTDGLGIDYNGHSVLVDFKGRPLLTFPENTSDIKTAEISLEPLQIYRQHYPVWMDADRFEIME